MARRSAARGAAFTNTRPNSFGSSSNCYRQTHNQLGSVSASAHEQTQDRALVVHRCFCRINIPVENRKQWKRHSCVCGSLFSQKFRMQEEHWFSEPLHSSSLSTPSLIFLCSRRLPCTLCVFVFIQMFEFDWHFLPRPCTSSRLLSSAICIPGKNCKQRSTLGGVVHALRRTPVVWLQLLNQRRYRVMFKGRFKVTLSTGPARFLHIKHSYISVAGWIIDWTCYWTCYKMTPLRCGIDIFGASNKGFTPATRHLQLYGTLKLWLHDGLMGHFWKVMSNISRSVGIWRHFRKEEGASRCFVPEAPQRTAGIVAASICRLSEVMQTRLANETFNYISTSFLFEWEQLHGEGFLMNNLFWWIFSDHFSHIFLHWALHNFWHLTFFY